MRWLFLWATASPLDACLWLIAGIVGVLAVLFGVGLYRAIRKEMME